MDFLPELESPPERFFRRWAFDFGLLQAFQLFSVYPTPQKARDCARMEHIQHIQRIWRAKDFMDMTLNAVGRGVKHRTLIL